MQIRGSQLPPASNDAWARARRWSWGCQHGRMAAGGWRGVVGGALCSRVQHWRRVCLGHGARLFRIVSNR
ncbi:unnamed protein product, partial [Nesidiocoris tenuis]